MQDLQLLDRVVLLPRFEQLIREHQADVRLIGNEVSEFLERAECFQRRREFHAIIGSFGRAARQFFFDFFAVAIKQQHHALV